MSRQPTTDNPFVLMIGGASGSGKTTLAKGIQEQLAKTADQPTQILHTDDYAKIDKLQQLIAENRPIPFGAPLVFDIDKFASDLASLRERSASPVFIIEGCDVINPNLQQFANQTIILNPPLATCLGQGVQRYFTEELCAIGTDLPRAEDFLRYQLESRSSLAPKTADRSSVNDYKKQFTKLTGRWVMELSQVINRFEGQIIGISQQHAAFRRCESLNLPVDQYIAMPIGDFAKNPDSYLAQLEQANAYYVSITSGLAKRGAKNFTEIIDFVQQNLSKVSPYTELLITHDETPALTGHIKISDDKPPNSILAEFTHGEPRSFHRGMHRPEISLSRNISQAFRFDFCDALVADGDWRNDEKFVCHGGKVYLSRPQMAERIWQTLHLIPHEDDYYLPGYYEVFLRENGDNQTRAAFTEANTKGAI